MRIMKSCNCLSSKYIDYTNLATQFDSCDNRTNKKIIILLFILLFLSNNCLASYISTNKFTKKIQIAKPIINLKNDDILLINKNSDENYYCFSVTNFNGDNINEIKFNYTLEIEYDICDCIIIEAYKNNNLIRLENNRLYNNKITNNKQTDDYIIKILYDETLNKNKVDIKQKIKINIYIEQI